MTTSKNDHPYINNEQELAQVVEKLGQELKSRIAEASEARRLKLIRRENAPSFPDGYDRLRSIEESFLNLLTKPDRDIEKLRAAASEIEKNRSQVIGDKSLPLHKDFSGVAETMVEIANLAQGFLNIGEALPVPRKTEQLEIEYSLLVSEENVPSYLQGRDAGFYQRYWALVQFRAAQCAFFDKDVCDKSFQPEDAQLRSCVDLSFGLAQDYLNGHVMTVGDITSSVHEIADKTRAIADAGGDIDGFPYAFCRTAKELAEQLHERVIGNIASHELLIEACRFEMEQIPPSPPKPAPVLSALAGQKPAGWPGPTS